jgi:hypothetical protein
VVFSASQSLYLLFKLNLYRLNPSTEIYHEHLLSPPHFRLCQGPSFSWAAIDSPHGITYGDVTDYSSLQNGKPIPTRELLFRAVDYSITLADSKNPFGIVTGGKLLLAPRYLQRMELYKLPVARRVPFAWRLKIEPEPKHPQEYTNIYIDASKSDMDMSGQDAHVYCMPAAYGERTVRRDVEYLYCLLLKCEGTVSFPTSVHAQKEGRYRTFRRVGITKLRREDERAQAEIMEVATQEVIDLLVLTSCSYVILVLHDQHLSSHIMRGSLDITSRGL